MSLTSKITDSHEEENLINATHDEIRYVKSFVRGFQYQILNVKKVKNSFLEAMYAIKKAEIRCRFEERTRELTLLHVTSASRAEYIVKDNFDWRRVRRGKFGLGTSFSGDANYADQYANFDIGGSRAVVLALVLVSNSEWGYWNLEQLSEQFDTSTGNNFKVYVKFYDNEMLPLYVAYYNQSENQVLSTFNVYNVRVPAPDFRAL